MAVIEKFLGKRVEIPNDLKYDVKQGLWVKSVDQSVICGLTEPALVLAGGINDLAWLVQDREQVEEDRAVVFAITGKILYITTPFAGIIFFNQEVKRNPSLILQEPYEKGWLFRIEPDAGVKEVRQTLADANGYIGNLKSTEGFKNPEGLKGGVSGICKAVYSGIREQKI